MVLLSGFAFAADGVSPKPYVRDVFTSRVVDACAVEYVLAAFPVQGGRDWIFAGAAGGEVVSCEALPKLKPTPVPASVLRGTEMEGWKVFASGEPETVELFNDVPHRMVTAAAVGPKAKRETTGPCHEPQLYVVCEGSDDDGSTVTQLRQGEAALRRSAAFFEKGQREQARALAVQGAELLQLAEEGRKSLAGPVVVKTSDGGLQSREQLGQRVATAMETAIELLKATKAPE